MAVVHTNWSENLCAIYWTLSLFWAKVFCGMQSVHNYGIQTRCGHRRDPKLFQGRNKNNLWCMRFTSVSDCSMDNGKWYGFGNRERLWEQVKILCTDISNYYSLSSQLVASYFSQVIWRLVCSRIAVKFIRQLKKDKKRIIYKKRITKKRRCSKTKSKYG